MLTSYHCTCNDTFWIFWVFIRWDFSSLFEWNYQLKMNWIFYATQKNSFDLKIFQNFFCCYIFAFCALKRSTFKICSSMSVVYTKIEHSILFADRLTRCTYTVTQPHTKGWTLDILCKAFDCESATSMCAWVSKFVCRSTKSASISYFLPFKQNADSHILQHSNWLHVFHSFFPYTEHSSYWEIVSDSSVLAKNLHWQIFQAENFPFFYPF